MSFINFYGNLFSFCRSYTYTIVQYATIYKENHMAIKCKELAKILGVSPATVSLVLNNKPGISAALRSKLIEQIRELGHEDMLSVYNTTTPSSSPDGGRMRNVIVYAIYAGNVSNNDGDSFFPAIIEGAEMQARDDNYTIQVIHLGADCVDCHLKDLINPDKTVGIIAQVYFVTDAIHDDLKATGLPFTVIDCYSYKRNISSVCVNNEDGIFMAVDYLKSLGHKNIGYIASGRETDSFVERRRCYHLALRELDLVDRPEFRLFTDRHGSDPAASLMNQWGRMDRLPTAFIVENDMLAVHVYKALKRMSYKVPDDISVIGFDDRTIANMIDPALTTVRVHRHLIGRQTVIMLKKLIDMKKKGFDGVPFRLNVGTHLIQRESCAEPLNDFFCPKK